MTPARALVVLHVETTSGPQRSLAPRLERLREQGTELTFLLPAPGPAARWAAALGDVRTGIPGAVMLPASPVQAWRAWRSLELQRRLTAAAVRDTGAELAVVSSPTMLGALRGARRAGAATLLYCGEVLARGGIRGARGALIGRAAARNADAVIAASQNRRPPVPSASALPVTVVHPPIAAPPAADELRRRGIAWRADHGLDARRDRGRHARRDHRRARPGPAGPGAAEARSSTRLAPSAIGGGAYDRPRDRAYAAGSSELIAELGVPAAST